MADDLGEKSEDATPKKREEAREEGNLARSQDIAGAGLLLIGTLILFAVSMPMLSQGSRIMAAVLDFKRIADPFDPSSAGDIAGFVGMKSIRIILPFLLFIFLGAYLTHFWQVGWLIAPKAIQPKLSKLNPSSGFSRIFGISGLVKATLDSGKVLVVVLVAGHAINQRGEEIATLPYLSMMQGMGRVGWMMLDLAFRILAVLIVLGFLDYIYQKWKHSNDLKMTKQQVKDEMKNTEGDPEVKKRRMRMQQQIAMQRLSTAVPKADVIVTNPEHIAIAIQYDHETMPAPKVVAKGADFLALRIRQIAMQHDIPIVERKPLARALYKDVEVGQEVPSQFFEALAEILAYVYRLNGRMAS